MRQPKVQFKKHGLLYEHCACHKFKTGAVVFPEHLCLPYVHLKKCMGCFSKICLPQVHKECRGFCWTLAPTHVPFKYCRGCFSKLCLPQNRKEGFLWTLWRPPRIHLKECRECFSNSSPATVQFKKCGVSPDNMRPPRFLRLCQFSQHLRRRLCAKCFQFFEKKGRIKIFHFNEEDSGQPFGNSRTVYSLLYCNIRAISWKHEKLEYQFRANIFRDLKATWQHRSWSCIFFPKAQKFLVTTCAYHYPTSIVKSGRAASQNCIYHSAKTVQRFLANTLHLSRLWLLFKHCAGDISKNIAGGSCEHLRLPRAHFKECRGVFSKLFKANTNKKSEVWRHEN